MASLYRNVTEWTRTPGGQKAFRYMAVSVVTVAVVLARLVFR